MPDKSEKLVRVEPDATSARLAAAAPARGYGYGYGSYDEPQGFEFRNYLRVLNKNRWLILTLVVVVTTIVAIAAQKVEADYVATATLQIGDPNRSSIAESRVVGYDYWSADKYYKTQINLLTMPDLIRKVVVELELDKNPKFFSARPKTLGSALFSLARPGAVEAAPAKAPVASDAGPAESDAVSDPLDPYVYAIIGGLDIRDVRDTQLLTLSFHHHDPAITAQIVNKLAEVYIRDNLDERIDTRASASTFLQRRISELQAQIKGGEERLLEYGKTHEILSLDEKQNVIVDRLAELNKQLLDAEAERLALEAQRESMANVGAREDILRMPEARTDEGIAELSRALTVLRQRKLELEQRYTDAHPEMQKVNDQIAALEADLDRSKGRIAASVEARYQAAVARESKLRVAFDEQRGKTMEQNEAAISYRILQQEVDTNKELLNTLLQRSKEIDISAASTTSNVLLKNKAPVPKGASGPRRSSWVLSAFLLSLVGGIGLAFGRELLDQSIKSIDDINRVVRLPSLGIIPALEGKGPRRRRRLTASTGGSHDQGGALITSLEAKSMAAEAYRHLRTSVLLSSAGHPSKLLMVTSSQPREGKTTTAVNTAISLAQTGAKVVIIDCDLRRPRVHQLLNADNTVGISLYLSGQEPDLDALIQDHQIPNLSILACGPVPPNPAELLGSDKMRELLSELVEQYDHIVIDTPPVVSFADPVILSTMVDGVILVVRGGFSTRNIVLRSRQLLSDVGAKIYGVVLNDAEMKSETSYYYGQYYNNYYENGEKQGGGRD